MIKIGLIGEDPNDTESIQNLLKSQLNSVVTFKTICKNLKGYQLESPKFCKKVEAETREREFDIIICIRDLDAFKSERDKVLKRQEWFEKIKKSTNSCKSVFLLNVWELEAILFADLAPFNKKFGTFISYSKDPSSIKEPKERLKSETRRTKRKYAESDCKDLFAKIDFDKVYSKCSFFKDFILELQEKNKAIKQHFVKLKQ